MKKKMLTNSSTSTPSAAEQSNWNRNRINFGLTETIFGFETRFPVLGDVVAGWGDGVSGNITEELACLLGDVVADWGDGDRVLSGNITEECACTFDDDASGCENRCLFFVARVGLRLGIFRFLSYCIEIYFYIYASLNQQKTKAHHFRKCNNESDRQLWFT